MRAIGCSKTGPGGLAVGHGAAFGVSQIASASMGDRQVADDAYERLLEIDLEHPNVPRPMMAVVRGMGDQSRLEQEYCRYSSGRLES